MADEKTDKPAKAGKQYYVADEFTSSVFVHGSTDPGTGNSLVLTGGDPVPAEAVEELMANPNVPLTTVKSRKARAAQSEEEYAAERAAELAAAGAPGSEHGSSGSAEGGFDPGRHTVEEVRAYLEDHPEQVSAILALEQGGLNRKGILGA